MKTRIFVGALCAALAACQAEKPVADMSWPEIQALGKQIGDRCVKDGEKPGTPGFDACRTHYAQQEIDRRNLAIENRQRIGMAMAGGLTAMGNGYNAAATRPVYVAPAPVSCTSMPMGNGMVTTHCY